MFYRSRMGCVTGLFSNHSVRRRKRHWGSCLTTRVTCIAKQICCQLGVGFGSSWASLCFLSLFRVPMGTDHSAILKTDPSLQDLFHLLHRWLTWCASWFTSSRCRCNHSFMIWIAQNFVECVCLVFCYFWMRTLFFLMASKIFHAERFSLNKMWIFHIVFEDAMHQVLSFTIENVWRPRDGLGANSKANFSDIPRQSV